MNEDNMNVKIVDAKETYYSIKILRVFACLAVFVVHFGQRVNLIGIFRTLSDFGQYGVQLFFIISGFLAAKGINENSGVSTLEYFKKRAIRILPLYILSLIWFFVTENILNFYFHQIPKDPKGLYWIRYIFCLNGFVNSDTYFWSNLGITWTIPIFISFYAIAPFTIKRMKSTKSALFISGLIIVISRIAFRFYYCTIFENIWIFFLGVIAYFSVKNSFSNWSSLCLKVLAIVFIIFGRESFSYCFLLADILILLVNYEDRLNLNKKTKQIIDYIDKRSYTLYLVHGMVFCSVIDRLSYINISNGLVVGLIATVLSLGGSVLIYRFYEKPIQTFLFKRTINE